LLPPIDIERHRGVAIWQRKVSGEVYNGTVCEMSRRYQASGLGMQTTCWSARPTEPPGNFSEGRSLESESLAALALESLTGEL
jgi:hypothetical protein